MKKVRPPAVAGKFYSDDKKELLSELELFAQKKPEYKISTRAVIVPHAGYYYSGQIANDGIQYLDKKAKNVFIIAPTHYLPFEGLALSSFDEWATPLGEVVVNQEMNKELISKFDGCKYLDEAFMNEHSAEVQVPFIQKYLPNASIIPILVGKEGYDKIAELINYCWDNPENVFVISSDLSHFYPSSQATKIDSVTADMIESNEISEFDAQQACGAIGVCGLVNFADEKGYSLIRVGLTNSGAVTGDETSVVGYGSWMLYEGEKTTFIKKYFSELIIDVCKKSILFEFDKKVSKIDIEKLPAVFNENGACFVTLEIDDELRGCIGSIIAHRSLIEDLIENANNAAFSDPRFLPLKASEFKNLSIAVSLLSTPVKMNFNDETDLLNQIKPFVDGIIIKDGGHQAVYLPSVWEQLPDKSSFLNSLKQKAGLEPNHFSKNFEAYRFRTEYVK